MRQEGNSIITLCPGIGQLFINEPSLSLLCVATLLIGGLSGCACSTPLLVFSLLFSLRLLHRLIYLRSIRHHAGNEQLICEHGVLQRSMNYMELYRMVGSAEHQTLIRQLYELKDVTVSPVGRTTPKLETVGISNSYDVVSIIRTRVETNKRRKSVYEITNR